MREPAEILSLIEGRLKELGLTQADLGLRAFGKADNTAIQSLKKGSSPSYDRVAAMADALGLELYLGKPRGRIEHGLKEDGPTSDLDKVEALRAGFLPIPWHHRSKQKGSSPIAFDPAWLDSNGLIPDGLSAIVPDQVNLPYERSSSVIAVMDRARTARVSGAVYCFSRHGKIVLSRLYFDRDFTIIPSEGISKAPTILAPGDEGPIQHIETVVWHGFIADV